MTTTVKPPRAASPKPKGGPRTPRSSGGGALVLSRGSEQIEGLVLGGEPRVHLIPPTVLARKKGKDLRRRLGLGIVGVIVLVAAGLGLATLSTAGSQNSLLAAQQQTTSILQEQAKYGDVLKVKADAASIQASQKTATAQEILWAPFYKSFEATVPSGGVITALSVSLDNPLGKNSASTGASSSSAPLQGAHVATIQGTLTMPQGSIAGWLDSLPALTGFVDVTPSSITGAGTNYTVSITMHINSAAFANRFTKDAGTTK
jgi:hypothetical protein